MIAGPCLACLHDRRALRRRCVHAGNLSKELVIKVQHLRARAETAMVYKEAAMLQRLEGKGVRVPSLVKVIWTREWAYLTMTCACPTRAPATTRRHRSQTVPFPRYCRDACLPHQRRCLLTYISMQNCLASCQPRREFIILFCYLLPSRSSKATSLIFSSHP